MSDGRAKRAAERRAAEIPGQIVECGTEKPALYEGLSPEERLIAFWRLIERVWRATGKKMPEPRPRAELPGEVFQIK